MISLSFFAQFFQKQSTLDSVDDLGRIQGFPPMPNQRVSVLFLAAHVLLTDLKIFLKVPLAPVITNFEGKRAAKS